MEIPVIFFKTKNILNELNLSKKKLFCLELNFNLPCHQRLRYSLLETIGDEDLVLWIVQPK